MNNQENQIHISQPQFQRNYYLTWAAIILCRSCINSHFAQRQFRYEQCFLWPLNPEITPWLRHLAHFGTLAIELLPLDFSAFTLFLIGTMLPFKISQPKQSAPPLKVKQYPLQWKTMDTLNRAPAYPSRLIWSQDK